MKTMVSALALLVSACILGCTDVSITDPVAETTSPGPDQSVLQAQNYLVLNAVVREPGNGYNSFVEIDGAAVYQAIVFVLDPAPPVPQHAVRLILAVSADLRPYHIDRRDSLVVWRVSGASDDMVPIPDSGTTLLTKRYRVEGRSDGVSLNVRLRIAVDTVEVDEMWLELGLEPDSTL